MVREVLDFDAESLEPGSLRYDLLMALPAFRNLLDTCISRYLTDPDDFTRELAAVHARQTPTPYTPVFNPDSDTPLLNTYAPLQPSEGPLISKVGGWGILAAEVSIALQSQAKVVDQRWLQAAMRSPELFALPADPWVSNRIAAFGQAYMRDMYACVGFTAPEPGTSLSVDEQFDVLKGLYSAVHELGHTETGTTIPFNEDEIANMLAREDTSGRPYYDPLLLSPKAFPNNLGADPTCAAQMAIFAGFCEAAGWPHMTANTLVLGEVYSKTCLGRVTSETVRLVKEKNGGAFHPTDYNVLLQTETAVINAQKRDRGFHGCNLVRLADNRWWQFDLTRGIMRPYEPIVSRQLDISYDSLQVARQGNIPMARVFNETEFLTVLDELSEAAEDAASRMLDVGHIRRQLGTLGKRPSIDEVVDRLILPIILPELPKGHAFLGGRQNHRRLITKEVPYWLRSEIVGKDYVRQAARELMTNLGFISFVRSNPVPHKANHDNKPCEDSCLRETLANPKKYESLAYWIRTAPIMFYQKLANDLCKLSLTPGYLLSHPSLELTNPAMHLGVTVLGAYADIYAKDDEQLPAAWWPTYDPTHGGSLTHIYDAPGTSGIGQTINVVNLLGHLPSSSLLDTTKGSRIKEFLRSVNTDGDAKRRARDGQTQQRETWQEGTSDTIR